jgi:hypothetical protein
MNSDKKKNLGVLIVGSLVAKKDNLINRGTICRQWCHHILLD